MSLQTITSDLIQMSAVQDADIAKITAMSSAPRLAFGHSTNEGAREFGARMVRGAGLGGAIKKSLQYFSDTTVQWNLESWLETNESTLVKGFYGRPGSRITDMLSKPVNGAFLTSTTYFVTPSNGMTHTRYYSTTVLGFMKSKDELWRYQHYLSGDQVKIASNNPTTKMCSLYMIGVLKSQLAA